MDNKSLAHTTWNCKYHIVFAQEYRRQVIDGQIKADVGRKEFYVSCVKEKV